MRHGESELSLSCVQACAVPVAAVIIAVGCAPAPTSSGPRLEATVVTEHASAEGKIEASSMQRLNVTWDVENVGDEPATGLVLKADCSCHVKDPLPETLAAGETARVTVSVRAPQAGTARRLIPIFGADRKAPLAALSVVLRVPTRTRTWFFAPPERILVTGLIGRPLQREFTWEAIERASAKPWIRAVHTESDDVQARLAVNRKRWGEDDVFCLRQYRVRLSIPRSDVAERRGMLRIETDPTGPDVPTVPWIATNLAALSVMPESARLQSSGRDAQSKVRVALVCRLPETPAVLPRLNSPLLDVVPIKSESAQMRAFEVRLKRAPSRRELQVVLFTVKGEPPARLRIELLPD